MRPRILALALLASCAAVSPAQWNAKRIEDFAAEFRASGSTLPPHKAGQMMGALAQLGITSAKQDLKAMDPILDKMIADPAALKEQLNKDREAVTFVNLNFNVLSTMGDYERATKLVKALNGAMWLLGAETAFLDAPYASQKMLLPLIVGSADQVTMLAAMMKGAALAGEFDAVTKHADELIAITKSKNVEPTQAVLDRFFDLKFTAKALDYVAANPRSTDYAKNLVKVGTLAYRAGDLETLDRIPLLLADLIKVQGNDPAAYPEFVWGQTMRTSEPEKVIEAVTKVHHLSTFQFFRCIQRHAEALMLRAKFDKVQALLATYPANQDPIVRGVLVTQANVDDMKGAKANIKLLPRRLMALEFLIETGYFDDAAVLYDEIGKDLVARNQFFCARNIAKGYLDAGNVEAAVKVLDKAKTRLLTPDPSFTTFDSNFSDLAILYGRSGDLATMKELLAKRKVNDYPKPAEALHESFMAAFRAGLVRK